MKFPEHFTTVDKLNYIERMVLLHSIIYYEMNDSIISDERFNNLAKLLVKKVEKYSGSKLFKQTMYGYVFEDYTDPSTGFYLTSRLKKKDHEYLKLIASHVIERYHQSKKKINPYVYKTEPWKHQKKALAYLYKKDAAALYTDMGTGKTKVMIDLIQSRKFSRVLIVAPKKACDVWEEQIGIHGVDGLWTTHKLSDLSRDKVITLLQETPPCGRGDTPKGIHAFIINYDKVWMEGIDKTLLKYQLDCVICDESHRIKTPKSKCSMYLAKLGKVVPYRYLVTGTPLAEKPTDIFAQYKFLDPSIFGTTIGRFREEYENLDPVMTARIGHRILDKYEPYKNLDQLREKMFSCAFFAESSLELPEQLDIEWKFALPPKTEALYHDFLKEKVAELNGMWLESNNALTTILRLQQITSGYANVEDIETKERQVINIDHCRREELQELLQEFPKGEPIVVFAHYKKDLKNIHRACREIGLTSSEVSGSVDTLKEWKQGLTQVIAVQYSSGSESIDLTRACYAIYYSMTHRLALYEQSRKRIHRPGQTRSVRYYHMIATMRKGQTIDQKIYNSHKLKKDIVDYVMDQGWS